MATRFHLPSSGAAPISPSFDASWEQQGAGDRIALFPKGFAPVTTLTDASRTVPITTTQQILTRQFVGPPMRARRITGTVSMVVRCSENANTNNAFLAFVLRVLSMDGGTVRGTLASSMTNAGTEFALTASAATRIFSAVALTELTAQEGDRVVLELGIHAQAPTAAGSAILRFGTSAASDFALTTALTTDLNPWIEFSEDLYGTRLNNYQFVRADSGISVAEKIR